MMYFLCTMIFLSGGYPIWVAWRANRRTALVHALGWGVAAWVTWIAAMVVAHEEPEMDSGPVRYLALCLTGCVMVAVLGARQPGAAAWNLVVAGLLAVLLLPLAEHALVGGRFRAGWFRAVLVGSVLAVGVVNYLPTRLGPAGLVLALGSILELLRLTGSETPVQGFDLCGSIGCLVLAWTPWVALVGIGKGPAKTSQVDRLWLGFRNRFGLVWGQRLREQFNRSAARAGWPVQLTWQGLRRLPGTASRDGGTETPVLSVLAALMKRFGSAAEAGLPEAGG
jgi:hypothetical protein